MQHRFGWGRFARLASICLLAGALAAACSDEDSDEPASAAVTATATATAKAAATTAATGAAKATGTGTATAGASTVAVKVAQDALGSYLVGPNGRTLYIFTRDTPGTTNCSGNCVAQWPRLMLTTGQTIDADGAAEADFKSIDTPEGKQVTYRDAPLYYYTPDTAAGQTTGHKVGNVWFVARPSTASTAVIGVQEDGAKAPYLVGPTGLTLYTFDRDTAGTSNCSGTCIETWPALTVPNNLEPTAVSDASGTLGVFVRDDAVRHVTYNGEPLYYYTPDRVPGDTTGDGVGGVWHLATP